MVEKKICTNEYKHKKAGEYGEWFYIKRMKFFHERFKQEYRDHNEYFSNMAIHDSYEEEHIAEKLCSQCTGRECLIEKRKANVQQTMNEKPVDRRDIDSF